MYFEAGLKIELLVPFVDHSGGVVWVRRQLISFRRPPLEASRRGNYGKAPPTSVAFRQCVSSCHVDMF